MFQGAAVAVSLRNPKHQLGEVWLPSPQGLGCQVLLIVVVRCASSYGLIGPSKFQAVTACCAHLRALVSSKVQRRIRCTATVSHLKGSVWPRVPPIISCTSADVILLPLDTKCNQSLPGSLLALHLSSQILAAVQCTREYVQPTAAWPMSTTVVVCFAGQSMST